MKDFWEEINNNLGFVFISGVPAIEFKDIINGMVPSLLHYVPAVNNIAALGLATGAYISGFKSLVILPSSDFFPLLYQFENINKKEKMPVIFLTDGENNPFNLKTFNLSVLLELDKYVYKDKESAILVV